MAHARIRHSKARQYVAAWGGTGMHAGVRSYHCDVVQEQQEWRHWGGSGAWASRGVTVMAVTR